MFWFIIAIVVMLTLLVSGQWIAFAIGAASMISLYAKIGAKVFPLLGMTVWQGSTNFVLSAIPLFILMGEIIGGTGIMARLYAGLTKTLHGLKGELVQANIISCTFFAAASGSSVASAATMGRIAYPDMVVKRGYDKNLVLGSIAAGGTLGILIPPSVIFILYGAMAEESVGKLFIAGLFPGLMLSAMFMIYIAVRTTFQPHLVPIEAAEAISLRERMKGMIGILPILILILVILGSIYGGITTPTEAAAVGAVGALILGGLYRRLTLKIIYDACLGAVRTTAMIFFIMIAAKAMAMALAYYRITPMISEWGAQIGSPMVILIFVAIFYLILGMLFDAISMMVLTLPFILPLIEVAGFDLIFFGVILVVLIEIGLLTPPVGLNLFVLQGVTGAPFGAVMKGSLPFVLILAIGLVILTVYPQIAMWLPSTMITK